MSEVKSKELLIAAKNIAVIRTDRLGDMILTLPLCFGIKKYLPDSRLTLISRSYVKPVLDGLSFIDEIVYIEDYQDNFNKVLKEKKIDAIFFPRPRFKECLACFTARIPLRIGSAYRWYSFLMNHKVHDHRRDARYHEAEYNTRLLASALGREVETKLVSPVINQDAMFKIKNILNEYGIRTWDKFIILHPGSGGSSIVWSTDNFRQLGIVLTENRFKVILTGSKEEQKICESIADNNPRIINLSGRFDLYEMIALISTASLLIANSTGIIHIAAALGTPVVGLYPNSPSLSAARWGPYSPNAFVLSPPPEDKLKQDEMNEIKVSDVFDASIKIIG